MRGDSPIYAYKGRRGSYRGTRSVSIWSARGAKGSARGQSDLLGLAGACGKQCRNKQGTYEVKGSQPYRDLAVHLR